MDDDLVAAAIGILDFPFFAVGLGDLIYALNHPRIKEGTTYKLKVQGVAPERLAAVVQAVARFIQKISVPKDIVSEVGSVHIINSTPELSKTFADMTQESEPRYRIQIGVDEIRWEELSPWPAAYSAFLCQMAWLVTTYALLIKQKLTEIPGLSLLDNTSRTLPTLYHYAAASLGAWGGGAINMQFLGYAAILDGLERPEVNQETMKLLGFESPVAESLAQSGLIAVHPKTVSTVFEAQGDSLTFGGLPVDEWNAANPPARSALGESDPVVFGSARERLDLEGWKAANYSPISALGQHSTPEVGGLLIDKHYRSGFNVRRPGGQALYGMLNLLRDHYSDFYEKAPCNGLLRCKHYCVPIIEVATPAELNAWVERIPIRDDSGIFFRGQTTLYKLSRSDCAKAMLFGSSVSDEPSLGTSAARRNFNYDGLHFALRYFLQNRLLFNARYPTDNNELIQIWSKKSQSPVCEIDYAIMALAQHYGLPSHGLDVTSSTDIAIWFATNRWGIKDGTARYDRLEATDWGDNRERWPVVFACQQVTHSLSMSFQKCEELAEFGLIAKRPERQKASFFHGGHSDHQNRLAEAVICAFRLRPGSWKTEAAFETLFPAPDQDPAYALMLEFAEVSAFAPFGAGEVARYAH